MDPADPKTLYVSFYQRLRRPYRFDSGGPDSGIFKSTDAGKTWRRLTRGLPTGDLGRIGLAIYRKNPRILMAIVEHGFNPPETDPAYTDMSRLGSGVYRSIDGGETWTYLNRHSVRPFFFSQIRINPSNDQHVYVLDVNFYESKDGGRTLEQGARKFGYDFHAMWIDPNQHDRYYLGQDKGFFVTHDHGRTFHFFDNLPVAQYYAIGVDMRDPYYIYGGLQDNGSWGTRSFTRDAFGIRNDDTWKMHWGDGMHAAANPDNWRQVYTEAENGSFRRYDALTYAEVMGRPKPGEHRELRGGDRQAPSVRPGSDRRTSPRSTRRCGPIGASGSTGRRRSSSRPTTGARSTSAATASSSPSTAARRGGSSAPTCRTTTPRPPGSTPAA